MQAHMRVWEHIKALERAYKFWSTYKCTYEFGSTYERTYKRSYVRFFAPGAYLLELGQKL